MGRQRRGLWRTGNELRTRDRPARTIHGSRRIGDGRLHRQRPGRRIAVASKFPLKASFSDRYGRTGARRTGAGRASLAPASWDRNSVAAAFTAAEAKLRWPPSLMAASEEHCPYCGRYGKAVLLDLDRCWTSPLPCGGGVPGSLSSRGAGEDGLLALPHPLTCGRSDPPGKAPIIPFIGQRESVITLVVDQGEQARYSQTKREILRIFEPNTTNPWLQESSGGE